MSVTTVSNMSKLSHEIIAAKVPFQVGRAIPAERLINAYNYQGDTAERFQVLASYHVCFQCQQKTLYTLRSYDVVILELCTCGVTDFNTRYYSDTTTVLQTLIIRAFPFLAEQWEDALENRQAARREAMRNTRLRNKAL